MNRPSPDTQSLRRSHAAAVATGVLRVVHRGLALLAVAVWCCGLPALSGVVINELMYHPSSEVRADEFVELHNPGGTTEVLDGWCFDGIQYCFGAGATLAPGGYLVLAADASQFLTTYGTAAFDEYVLNLDDNGERLALLDGSQVVQDEVSFDDGPPWPVTPDGLGPSLELIDAVQDNDTPRNWAASTAPAGHTAGVANSVAAPGLPPWIQNVQRPASPAPSSAIVVTAEVLDGTSVDLSYRIDFGGETTVSMLDDGVAPDTAAGDGFYAGTIPGQADGTMVRFRISATGATGTMSYPRTDDSVVYDGTVVVDPALSSALPIFHWFMDPVDFQNATCNSGGSCHLLTDDTEPAWLYYDGRFYDGVQARVRGESARQWAKKNWKFLMPQGHNFEAPGLLLNAVDNFNLQGSYADKTFVREMLAWESLRDAGAPYLQTFHVRLHHNGPFFGLYVFLEDQDRDWLRRSGLSPTAARYKAFNDLRNQPFGNLPQSYEKQTRLTEDYTDLFDFIGRINDPVDWRDFLFDHLDIPATVNYLAAMTIMHNNDHAAKNYFVHRDTDGTQRWTMHAWDLDLTFGKNFTGNGVFDDVLWADVDSLPGLPSYISPSHPQFGETNRRKIDNRWNRLIDRVFFDAEMRSMYYRRLRTLMDELLEEGLYEARIDALALLIGPEAALDAQQTWGQTGAPQDLATAVDLLKTQYLDLRRVHLFQTHSVCSTEVPPPQTASPRVVINEIMYNPSTGLNDEYVELYNPSATESVDVSGWRLDGVALTLPAGTVILPQSYALLVKQDPQFRAVYGGGKFVAAEYAGSLSDVGESLVLRNRFGAVVSSVTYESVMPWPTAASGGGFSLELIDASQGSDRVANWWSSTVSGGTPGASNSMASILPLLPELHVNEVLVDNGSVNQDNAGDFDPWVELYNASSQPLDLTGLYLSDDLQVPAKWAVPAGTQMCGGCWQLVWADGETGEGPVPPHASFTLSGLGGFVGVFASDGTLIDYVNYGPLPVNHSWGRFPDGTAEQRVFPTVTPESANDAPISPLILNEYNAVKPSNLLDNGNSDVYWGRVAGNGGDWFELVVTSDHLDVRGWELELTDDAGGAGQTVTTLTLTSDAVWSDLRAGTVVTVSEDLASDVSFDPQAGDWWINVRASSGASGQYVTAQDFEVSNVSWQLVIRNAAGVVVFGPAGEGIVPLSGVGADEVFKLEDDPGPFVTPVADYNDGTSSTFGQPNVYSAGSAVQDFTALRAIGSLGTCTVPDADGDLVCDQQDNCPAQSNADQADADGDGIGDVCDACPIDPANDADMDGLCADADNCPTVTNAGQADGDGDLVGDVCDNCASSSNTDQADEDGDAIGDACDLCLGDPVNDPDADGICHANDNCPADFNASQADLDGDLWGDACDMCRTDPFNDIDLDGYCDSLGFLPPKLGDQDNCPKVANPSQSDSDADGSGDFCDNCPSDPNATQSDQDADGLGDACDPDLDGDGLANGSDNCAAVYNPDQTNTDGDAQGDACDSDDDNDGTPDAFDLCPLDVTGNQTDSDSDGVGNGCDCKSNNGSVASIPAQVGPVLRLDDSAGATTLYWKRAPQGHASNVYRGTHAAGQVWSYDLTCFVAETAAEQSDDGSIPPAGTVFYYLISGRNTCGEGPAGVDSSGSAIVPASPCSTPGSADADGDGVENLSDNCPETSNAGQQDADIDFLGDVCDNCVSIWNPTQDDLDGDGQGDVCDTDDDGDGEPDVSDNCPTLANPQQDDTDGDALGDLCDPCTDTDGDGLGDPGFPNSCPADGFPADVDNDSDGDGVSGVIDNCSEAANADQADEDQDGLGDACDACPEDPANDVDGDGLCAGDCGPIELEAALNPAKEVVLVEFASGMSFLANPTDPGLGLTWTVPGFNDAGWSTGSYGVGYEATGGAESLLLATVPVGSRSVYTRTTFTIADVAQVDDLFLGADYDDGYAVWLNGFEIYRSPEMPVGALDWDATPNAHESSNGSQPDYGSLIDVSAAGIQFLQNGTNVLAIGVWNHTPFVPPSDDLVLVPRLSINRTPTIAYLANPTDPGPGVEGQWMQPGFDDSSWGGGNFGIGFDTSSGNNALGLIETSIPPGAQSIYIRAEFEAANATFIDEVMLAADYDDGFVAWINGVEIYRSPEMPAGAPLWDTAAASHESSNGTVPDWDPAVSVSAFAIPAIGDGTNVLAIGVWNTVPTSSDLVLWPSLATTSRNVDNCPTVANPNQTDIDGDGVGDACDNCPAVFNAQQTDSDGDGTGDACQGS